MSMLEQLTMPELPEVETVRRGLAPAMEGARLVKVEVRDRRLRWPLAKDFEKRLTGMTVEGLGRISCPVLVVLGDQDFAGPAWRDHGQVAVVASAQPMPRRRQKASSPRRNASTCSW